MSSDQDNNDVQSHASEDSAPQMDYAGSDEDKPQHDGDNSDSDRNSDKNGGNSDNDDDYYNNDDYQQIHEETPDWRKKWEFHKNKISAPIQKRILEGDQRLTNPIITKHEYAKIIGLRAKQIYCGSALYHLPPQQMLQQPKMINIAQQQLKNKRMHSNGEYELWKIQQLQK